MKTPLTIPAEAVGPQLTPVQRDAQAWVALNWHEGLKIAGADSAYVAFWAFCSGHEHAHCVTRFPEALERIKAVEDAATEYMHAVDELADSLEQLTDERVPLAERSMSALSTSAHVGRCKGKLSALLAPKETPHA